MSLKNELLAGKYRVGVWGTGFIGYSTLAYFAEKGVRCVGFDIDKEKVDIINQGICPIEGLEHWLGFDVAPLVKSGLMHATTDFADLLSDDILVHFIGVPTEKGAEPWFDALINVISNMSFKKELSQKPLVIVESTLAPGGAEKYVIDVFEKHGYIVGEDVLFGVAPRRDWFVSPEKNLANLPRIFGGTTKETNNLMKEILSIVCKQLVEAPDHEHAEVVKAIENAYRHLDITLANELAFAYPHLNMREVLRMVGTKWNIGTFVPSFGTGGYCIPLSSKYVLMGAKNPDQLSLLKKTIEFDDSIPERLVDIIAKDSSIKSVGILGLSYKENIKVSILSPTLKLIPHLKRKGFTVKVTDPHFTDEEIESITGCDPFSYPDGLDQFDCILITAAHRDFLYPDYGVIMEKLSSCKIILDNTTLFSAIPFGEKYHQVGDGTLK